MAAVGNAVKQMDAQQIAEFESKGSVTLAGETLSAGEIKVSPALASPSAGGIFIHCMCHSGGTRMVLRTSEADIRQCHCAGLATTPRCVQQRCCRSQGA